MTVNDSLRAQLQALLQFQAGTPADGLPREDAAAMGHRLATFAAWCQAHARGKAWSGVEQAWWARVAQSLVASAAAQPVVALQPDGTGYSSAGPLLHDVVSLLRGKGMHDDESFELDEAVRWWQGACRAGLPVDADFGECWRALEWLGLQQHLLRLTRDAGDDEDRLLAAVAKVALRYGPLKPLLRLLPVNRGAEAGAGYTF